MSEQPRRKRHVFRLAVLGVLAAGYVAIVVAIAANNRDHGAALAWTLGSTAVIVLAFWLLPIYSARKRGARNIGSIVAITLLLGWTLIGWAAALAMALADTGRHS
jgi:hypothetical protein